MLFGSPVAGAGVGIDNIAFLSWFQYAGGKELYDQLWDEMGVNVKGFMLQPVAGGRTWKLVRRSWQQPRKAPSVPASRTGMGVEPYPPRHSKAAP